MIRKTLTAIFFITILNVKAQTVMRLNDPHIVAQEDRMVYKSWGNFLPKPKYFLGVQTRLSYSMTWGMLAPNQNKRYRRGADLRPLSATGEQTQRQLNTLLHNEQTSIMEEDAVVIGGEAETEMLHNSSLFYATDPLFVLYYRKKLKPIREWNTEIFFVDIMDRLENDKMFRSMELTDGQKNSIVTNLLNNSAIDKYLNEMDILVEKYDMATSLPMGRGARILSYHEMYIAHSKMYHSFMNTLLLTARIKANIEKFDRSRPNSGTPHTGGRLFDNYQGFDDLQTFYDVATDFRIKM